MAGEFDRLVQPDVQTKGPIGTLVELEKEGLDPMAYHSCSKPDSHNLGCRHWRTCRMSFKGEGKKNIGLEHIKGAAQGGGMSRFVADCLWYNDHQEDAVDNKGSLRVIAEEGETFTVSSLVLVDRVSGEPVKQGTPNAAYRQRRQEVLVKPFPRPGESEDIIADILKAEVREEEQEKMANEQRQRSLGIQPTAPVNPPKNRSGGGGKGTGA